MSDKNISIDISNPVKMINFLCEELDCQYIECSGCIFNNGMEPRVIEALKTWSKKNG